MGGAPSKNSVSIINEAIANVSTNILQEVDITSTVQQIIEAPKTGGDTTIENVTNDIRLNVNVAALSTALATSDSKQQIAAEIEQLAKSSMSGLNLFQFGESSNEIELVLKEMVNVGTNITQKCKTSVNTIQVISSGITEGNATIKNSGNKMLGELYTNCVQNAVSNSSILQSFDQRIRQSAVTDIKGLTLDFLIVLIVGIIAIIGLFIGGTFATVKSPTIALVIGGVLIITGIVFIYLYSRKNAAMAAANQMSSKLFSVLFSNSSACTGIEILSTVDTIASAIDAENACALNADCKAYDFEAYLVDTETNEAAMLPKPKTTLYGLPSPGCYKSVAEAPPDTVVLFEFPGWNNGRGAPSTSLPGTVYVNTDTSQYWVRSAPKTAWKSQNDVFLVARDTPISMSSVSPDLANPAKDKPFVLYDETKLDKVDVYAYDATLKKWVFSKSNPITGVTMIPSVPPVINASGVKDDKSAEVKKRYTYYLIIGIVSILLGLILMALYFFKRRKAGAPKVKK